MKHSTFGLLGLLTFLCAVPCVSGENEAGAPGGSSAVSAAGGSVSGNEVSAKPAAVIEQASGAAADVGSGGEKPASSAAAAGYLYNEVKEGNIKIEGATDTQVPDR